MADITERTIVKTGKGSGGWFVVTRFDDGTEVKSGPLANRAAARDEYRKLGGAVKPAAAPAAGDEKKGVDAA